MYIACVDGPPRPSTPDTGRDGRWKIAGRWPAEGGTPAGEAMANLGQAPGKGAGTTRPGLRRPAGAEYNQNARSRPLAPGRLFSTDKKRPLISLIIHSQ